MSYRGILLAFVVLVAPAALAQLPQAHSGAASSGPDSQAKHAQSYLGKQKKRDARGQEALEGDSSSATARNQGGAARAQPQAARQEPKEPDPVRAEQNMKNVMPRQTQMQREANKYHAEDKASQKQMMQFYDPQTNQ